MNKLNSWSIAIMASLLIAAPAFAQAQQTQTQHQQNGESSNPGNASGQHSQYSSGVHKQKTQGDITEVGPGSKAYYGNTQHSKY